MMDLLVQLIVGLGWPLAALGIVVLLRKDLGKVIGRVSRVRYKELEAEFHDTLRQIESTSPPATPEPGEADAWNPQLAERKKELYALAHISPRAAIMESWLDVESQIRRSAAYLGLDPTGDVLSLLDAIRAKSKLVSSGYRRHVSELRKLRNVAMHEAELLLPEAEVMQYVTLALELTASLDCFTNPEYRHHFRDEDG